MNKKVTILSNQTLADIALRETGTVETMFDIATLNGLNVSDELIAGIEILVPVIESEKKVAEFFRAKEFYPAAGYDTAELLPASGVDIIEVIIPKPTAIYVIERQTLADLSVQITGSVDAMFDLAELNDLNVSDWLLPGMKLKIPENISENDVNQFYKSNSLYPASGWTVTEQTEAETLSGIDYWAIEVDFEVQ